jgi:hypothetical protein
MRGSEAEVMPELADEMRKLGVPPERAAAYLAGKAAARDARKRYGPIPDHVADEIAAIARAAKRLRNAG